MQSDGKYLCAGRVKGQLRPVDGDPASAAIVVWRHLVGHKRGQIGSLPARLRQKHMSARQRVDAALDGTDIGFKVLGSREADNRLYDGECVAGAMVDFARQQGLLGLALLLARHIDDHAAEALQLPRQTELANRSATAPTLLAG